MGLGKSGWKPLAVSRRKYWAGSAQLKANGFILTSRRAKKLIPAKSTIERPRGAALNPRTKEIIVADMRLNSVLTYYFPEIF